MGKKGRPFRNYPLATETEVDDRDRGFMEWLDVHGESISVRDLRRNFAFSRKLIDYELTRLGPDSALKFLSVHSEGRKKVVCLTSEGESYLERYYSSAPEREFADYHVRIGKKGDVKVSLEVRCPSLAKPEIIKNFYVLPAYELVHSASRYVRLLHMDAGELDHPVEAEIRIRMAFSRIVRVPTFTRPLLPVLSRADLQKPYGALGEWMRELYDYLKLKYEIAHVLKRFRNMLSKSRFSDQVLRMALQRLRPLWQSVFSSTRRLRSFYLEKRGKQLDKEDAKAWMMFLHALRGSQEPVQPISFPPVGKESFVLSQTFLEACSRIPSPPVRLMEAWEEALGRKWGSP